MSAAAPTPSDRSVPCRDHAGAEAGGRSRPASFAATRFDGRSAAAETVLVRVAGEVLEVVSRGAIERFVLRDVGVSEAFAHAPRMLALPGGATLEVPDGERRFAAALAAAGVRDSWVVRLQRAWPAALAALVFLLALGAWIYVDGLPIAARIAASAMPSSVERRMGDSVLALLDQERLRPSRLPAERQAGIEKRFKAAVATAAPGTEVRLLFRDGSANAFAIPGGTIVLLDDLVAAAASDEEILGVLGHELGHVVERHSTRQLLQAVGVAAMASMIWGDFSSVAANVPAVMGMLRYGRAFEEDADTFAIGFLRRNGLSSEALATFLERSERSTRRSASGAPEFLSSHPDTASRIRRLRSAGAGEQAAR